MIYFCLWYYRQKKKIASKRPFMLLMLFYNTADIPSPKYSHTRSPLLTPPQNPQTIHHGYVWICTNDTVWEEEVLFFKNHSWQIFQIYLVSHSSSRRDYSHILKNSWTPLYFSLKLRYPSVSTLYHFMLTIKTQMLKIFCQCSIWSAHSTYVTTICRH